MGTRPEIVKVSSVLHEMNSRGLKFDLVHTGQHYDSNLSDVFFKELDLPTPDLNLKVGSGSQAEQTAMAIIRLERAFCTTVECLKNTIDVLQITCQATYSHQPNMLLQHCAKRIVGEQYM